MDPSSGSFLSFLGSFLSVDPCVIVVLSPVVELILCQLDVLVLAVNEKRESPTLMAASLTILMSIFLFRVSMLISVYSESSVF